ncbi:tetratricopeptide repeat protein [Rubrimonas sp.]|uniref:tetratricopeptide repeat protein n=1 Tax=Rubrimonas sp. TaxID=2036015 RepID=UPI002FDE37BC
MTSGKAALLIAALGLSACQSVSQFADPLAPDIVREAGLGEQILNSGDPNGAVRYFERAAAATPDDVAMQRSLAIANMRAGDLRAAERAMDAVLASDAATPQDRVERGFIAVRLDDWERAGAMTAALPPDLDTARRALLEALVADRARDWSAADAAYARALAGAENKAAALNNWGVSRLARGDASAAIATFERALATDPKLFAAKNNLAIARAMRGDYALPDGVESDRERAVLQHNMALVAQRKGDAAEARRLLERAIAAHPQHYRAAVEQLAALEN